MAVQSFAERRFEMHSAHACLFGTNRVPYVIHAIIVAHTYSPNIYQVNGVNWLYFSFWFVGLDRQMPDDKDAILENERLEKGQSENFTTIQTFHAHTEETKGLMQTLCVCVCVF